MTEGFLKKQKQIPGKWREPNFWSYHRTMFKMSNSQQKITKHSKN